MDFYVLLGVPREASDSDIRRAYKRLARRFHPDVNPGDRQAALRFRDILAAYETLVDPDRRRRYDQGEAAPVTDLGRAAGFEGFDFSPAAHAEPTTTFGDLFSDVLHPGAAARTSRGADLHASVVVGLEDLLRATTRVVPVTRLVACPVCAGRGLEVRPPHTCPACEGSGDRRVVRGHMVFRTPCLRCGGTGSVTTDRCRACAGRGTAVRSDEVDVVVPPGAPDGATVHRPGLGHAGTAGGPPGDLIVTVTVAPHATFTREGDDLRLEVPVALHEAALGTRITLPVLDGEPARLRVPPGTQSGRRFRLRGRGLPSIRDGRRGDVLAEIRIVLPAVLDERSKALLREFAALQRESVRDHRFPADEGGA